MESESKLKKCPFCGGEAEMTESTYKSSGLGSSYYIEIECNNHVHCKVAPSLFGDDKDETIKTWNTRHDEVSSLYTLQAYCVKMQDHANHQGDGNAALAFELVANKVQEMIEAQTETRHDEVRGLYDYCKAQLNTEQEFLKDSGELHDETTGLIIAYEDIIEQIKWRFNIEEPTQPGKEVGGELSLPDIRNKLTPFKNLIAMLENGLTKGTGTEVHPYIQKEMEQCKKSIAYLSGNEA